MLAVRIQQVLLWSLVFGSFLPIKAQVHLIVDEIPSNTPAGDLIHVAGNFQGWNPGDMDHRLAFDSLLQHHYITLDSGLGSLEFKFTRGSWDKVEGNANGGYIPNRSLPPSDGDTIHLSILGWEDLGSGGGGNGNSTASENVTILSENFYIPQLNRYRRIWVYLPADYDDGNRSYPVLYLHDGQNVFDASTSFSGEWKVDEHLDGLFEQSSDPGIIVVAIDNGGSHRIAEYSPWVNPSYGGGEGAEYVSFLVETLKPHIDSAYRTKTDAASTGIMGSSLGGLISIYAAANYPETFGRVGLFSPAYWFNPEIFDDVFDLGLGEQVRVYQIGGASEGGNMQENMARMRDTLIASGLSEDRVKSIAHTDGAHSEWYWAREFEAAYLWLFRSQPLGDKPVNTSELSAKLYPNPATDQVTVSFFLEDAAEVEITLLTLQGKELTLYGKRRHEPGDHTIELNLTEWELSPVQYFVKLRAGEEETMMPLLWVD